ncbi:uncharacterized protein [Mytilus edulis]|uniref:uncharacterized protein isoform X2 n=1 Tax=Mytilus edulis TaxID=6550 RepID=UPI0039EE2D16
MGSGSSKKATPTILKGYRSESAKTIVSAEKKTGEQVSNGAEDKKTVSTQIASNEKKISVVRNSEEVIANSSNTNGEDKFIKTIYGHCSSSWPVNCYGKLDFNVNAYHGGCTALCFVSCAFSGEAEQSNVELRLIRSGFDCNHVEAKSIAKMHAGHFGANNRQMVDEDGMFIADCQFGANDIMLLTNDSRYGNLRNGSFVEMVEGEDQIALPVNVNGGKNPRGCGLSLVLCSGKNEEKSTSALYLIRLGTSGNNFQAKVLSGEDTFKFGVKDDGQLTVSGPKGCKFAVFHNRNNLISHPGYTYVSQIQCTEGTDGGILMENLTGHATLIILCSNSNGTEDSTASSIYHLSVNDGNIISTKEISGCHGPSYKKSDLWTFEIVAGQLLVTGPTGPCKYGVLTNIKAQTADLLRSIKQDSCLATGEQTKTLGKVQATFDNINGNINKASELCIMMNHKIVRTIPVEELEKKGDQFTFLYQWKKEEKVVGYHMIRVFAVRKHVKSGEDVYMELFGSPCSLTRQKPGVIYALNCGGPAYQDLNDIVYSSEHKQFANFSCDFLKGIRSKARGGVKNQAKLPASMLKSHDGFLYVNTRTTFTQDEHDQRFHYQIKDLPNGKFKLRLHLATIPKELQLNGKSVGETLQKKILTSQKPGDLKGPTCYCVDIDVEIENNNLEVYSKSNDVYKHMDRVGALALLDKTYKDEVISETSIKEEKVEKQKLADQVLPIDTVTTRKEMTVVGWSPNLLQNASGESGDMKHWNTQGNMKVSDRGGFGTEACFVTGHMWCSKYQEVNLLETFSAEYLDKAPDIQVFEMYRQGHCGGGFYCLTAQLMSENGKVLKEYTTGEIGSINIANAPWNEASVLFSDYGPGVRIVAFTSKGKDDKFWAGHYGPFMSAAQIRVRRESNPAKDDSYTDILQDDDSAKRPIIDKLVTTILTDNQDLLENFAEEEKMPIDKAFDNQTKITVNHDFVPSKQWQKQRQTRKKREIRVFVSSTFRDFKDEREEIIKKAFREINRMCTDRGVFFTYVDLRWGITKEQTSHGQTISICLQEIDRCRPYFICLMGDRFGWCQTEDKPDDVLNMSYDYAIENNPKLKWIDKFRYDTSVTQLEVFHGVLNDPDLVKNKCFFYLRDPPSKEDFSEDEYKRLISESDWHRTHQDWLKDQVTKHKDLNVRTFKKPLEVSEYIKKDLERCLDDDFPKGTELSKLEQQREAHAAFSSARCRVYIGSQDYFTEINNNRSQNLTQPFVLLGESGCGKSALVANWVKQVEEAEPATFMFVHFIGSSADSANYIKLIRRLFGEIKVFFNFDMQIPSSDSILIHEIGKWLRMAGSLTKVVIVFDALNQLDSGEGELEGTEHDLDWIPPEIPPNVFVLISTLPGRAMTACNQAGWPSMQVQPLQDSQKMQILTEYLEGIYGKTLNQQQKEMIVSVKQTSNPLYLKSLLDEVRMYGSFRTLTEKIQEYLSADTPQDLFAKILDRLEEDFEKGDNARKHLVRDTTTALWCANKGMSESEIVELLDVTSAVWSPFYLSLYENLVNRNGLLNFFHDHLRQAVEKKYLSDAEAKRNGYLRLANFFVSKETSNRTVEELPFLLTRANELERLKTTVSDLDVFYRLSDNEDGIFELVKAWKTLGGFSLSGEAYMSALAKVPKSVIMENVPYYCKLYRNLGKFFLKLGLMEAAKTVYKTLIKQLEMNFGESYGTIVYDPFSQSWKYRCKHPDVITGLHDLGTVYRQLGEYDKAVLVYNDAINRQNRIRSPGQNLQLCEGLLGLSTVYINKEDMFEAKILMTRALELATFVLGKKHHFVAAILTKLGQLSYKQGRVDEALAYYMQDLKVTRSEVGTNHPRTAAVLNEIGLVYDDKNDVMAGQLYEAALSIILETYGNNYLGTGSIRYNLGAFYFGTNHFEKARFQFTESYKIHVMFLGDNHPDTVAVKEALNTVSAMTKTK